MTIWFLYPTDNEPRTNAYLVQIIGESNMENMWTGLCADNRPRNLYRCPNGWADAKRAIAGIREFSLKLEIFKIEGDNPPARFDLWKQSVKKKARHKRSALMPRVHKAKKPPRRVPF